MVIFEKRDFSAYENSLLNACLLRDVAIARCQGSRTIKVIKGVLKPEDIPQELVYIPDLSRYKNTVTFVLPAARAIRVTRGQIDESDVPKELCYIKEKIT